MDKLLKRLLDTGILIGSRRWGGSNITSDIDLVFDTEITDKIINYLEKIGIEIDYSSKGYHLSKMYNEGNFKFEINNKVINIISYKSGDIEKIERLNEYMDSIKDLYIGKRVANSKADRIFVVESYLEFEFSDKEFEFNKGVPGIDIDEDEIPF